MHRYLVAGFVAAMVALGTPCLSAAPLADAPRTATAAPGDVRVLGALGLFGEWDHNAGAELSLLTSVRYGFLEGGLLAEHGGALWDGSYGLIGGAFGPVYQAAGGFRLELLGVVGVSSYSGMGCGLFCEDGGASATLPWVGARLGTTYVFSRHRSQHFEIGGALTVGSDAERKSVTYTTTNTDLLDSNTHTESDTARLGGSRITLEFVFGFVFDLSE
ncbi:MAG TPA: hypothetical protein VGM29_07490 [Polyangiaceae bacterium]|jgi:hypothetical protein